MLNSLCLLEGKLDFYCVYLCPSNKWLLRNNLVMNLVYITLVTVKYISLISIRKEVYYICITSNRIWIKDNFIGGFVVN